MKKVSAMGLAALMVVGTIGITGSAEEPITITIVDWNTGVASELQKAACQEYMDTHPGIVIDHQTIAYEDYNTKLNTLIAAGQTPDIFYASDLFALNYGEQGVSQDLAPLYEAQGIDMKEKFIEPALYASGNAVYGLAYGVVSSIMYFDKEIFDNAGVEYPSQDPANPDTWDEWVEKLKLVTVDQNGKHPGEEGFNALATKTYGTIAPSWYYHLSAFLNSNEGSFFNESELTLGEEAGVEVVQAVNDLTQVHQVAPTPIAEDALPSVASMFKEDQLACYISGSYEYIDIAAENPEIGIAPLPMFKKPATIGWAACCQMSSTTEHPEEVFEFFRWYTEADTNPCHLASNLPNEYKYYEDESLFEVWMDPSVYNEDFQNVVPTLMSDYTYLPEMCQVKNAGKIFDEYVAPQLDKVWLGEQTPEEACAELSEAVNPIYEGLW
ncbi:MAG: ABC transporter substrate-binding protein [Marvinbryantia sp.]